MKRSQSGLGLIAAIMVLVILGALAAAIVSLSTAQQVTAAQDELSIQAWQTATAGTESGLFRALQNATCDTPPPQTWVSAEYPNFKVTVGCTFSDYNDGETTPGVPRVIRVFRIEATACNGGAATCPDNGAVSSIGYVERQRVAIAYCEWNGAACTGP